MAVWKQYVDEPALPLHCESCGELLAEDASGVLRHLRPLPPDFDARYCAVFFTNGVPELIAEDAYLAVPCTDADCLDKELESIE